MSTFHADCSVCISLEFQGDGVIAQTDDQQKVYHLLLCIGTISFGSKMHHKHKYSTDHNKLN